MSTPYTSAVVVFRARPASRVAAATAFATAGTTSRSNTDGRMYSAERTCGGTVAASAFAAASSTSADTPRARASRSPRNTPGHAGKAQQPGGRDPRGAGARDHDAQIGELARHNGRGIP